MSAIEYAGKNTVKAIMDNIKGDMSMITGTIVPTFREIYENLEALDSSKEEAFKIITKAQYESLTEEEKKTGNYVITDEDGVVEGIDSYARSMIEALTESSQPDLSDYEAEIDAIFAS